MKVARILGDNDSINLGFKILKLENICPILYEKVFQKLIENPGLTWCPEMKIPSKDDSNENKATRYPNVYFRCVLSFDKCLHGGNPHLSQNIEYFHCPIYLMPLPSLFPIYHYYPHPQHTKVTIIWFLSL